MEDNEYSNVFPIPANYTDSGKVFGGMLELRNTIEAAVLVVVAGYPELVWLSAPARLKIVLLTLTVLPLGVLALMGIDGDSLFQYIGHMVRFAWKRRRLHCRRAGYRYEQSQLKKKRKRTGRKGKASGGGKQEKDRRQEKGRKKGQAGKT